MVVANFILDLFSFVMSCGIGCVDGKFFICGWNVVEVYDLNRYRWFSFFDFGVICVVYCAYFVIRVINLNCIVDV